jgi:hypothetical protein
MTGSVPKDSSFTTSQENVPLNLTKLSELSTEQLEAVIQTLENKYPAPTVSSPQQLASEEVRYVLAFNAGKFSVVEDLKVALANVRKKKPEGSRA